MKKILILLSAAFLLVSFRLQGDADGIIKGLKNANAEQVSSYFDSFIDLKLPETVLQVQKASQSHRSFLLKKLPQ